MDKLNNPNSFDVMQSGGGLTANSPLKPVEVQRSDINIPHKENAQIQSKGEIDFGFLAFQPQTEGKQTSPAAPYGKPDLPSQPFTNGGEVKFNPLQKLRSWIVPKESLRNSEPVIGKQSKTVDLFGPSIGKETLGSIVDSPDGDPWARKAGWAEYNEWKLRDGWGEGEIGSTGEYLDTYEEMRQKAEFEHERAVSMSLSGPGLIGSSVDSPESDPWARKAGWDEYNEWKLRDGWGEGEVGANAELSKHDEWADKAMLAEYHEWKERATWGDGALGSDAEN